MKLGLVLIFACGLAACGDGSSGRTSNNGTNNGGASNNGAGTNNGGASWAVSGLLQIEGGTLSHRKRAESGWVAARANRLVFVDASNLETLVVADSVELPALIRAVEVVGNTIYALDDASTLHVLALDTTTLSEIGTLEVPNPHYQLTVAGDTMFVHSGPQTVVVDVSNPRTPAVAQTLDMSIESVTAHESWFYVVTPSNELLRLDASLAVEATYEPEASRLGPLTVAQGSLWVGRNDGFARFNLDPALGPGVVSYHSINREVVKLQPAGDQLWVSASTSTHIWDVASGDPDESSVLPLGVGPAGGNRTLLSPPHIFAQDKVYEAAGGLVEVGEFGPYIMGSQRETVTDARHPVALAGATLCTVDTIRGRLYTTDLRTGFALDGWVTFDASLTANVTAIDGVCFVATQSAVLAVDVADPAAPTILHRMEVDNSGVIAGAADHVFLTTPREVLVVDASDPEQLQVATRWTSDEANPLLALVANAEFVYATRATPEREISVFRWSSDAIEPVGRVSPGGFVTATAGDRLFTDNRRVFDVSSPQVPRLVNEDERWVQCVDERGTPLGSNEDELFYYDASTDAWIAGGSVPGISRTFGNAACARDAWFALTDDGLLATPVPVR